jgi:hypothetical protein
MQFLRTLTYGIMELFSCKLIFIKGVFIDSKRSTKVVQPQRIHTILNIHYVQILMNAKRKAPVSAVAAAAKIHGEAMNAAVVIPICYT